MADVLIALGSNQGDRRTAIERAVEQLARLPQTTVRAVSSLAETAAIGGTDRQAPYLNAAVRLASELAPRALFAELAGIESAQGRVRNVRWESRTIDLDLLLYDDLVLDEPDLRIPHPRMSFRLFVLRPAVEVAASMRHPPSGRTLEELLHHLESRADVAAIVAPDRAMSAQLAHHLSQERLATVVSARQWRQPQEAECAATHGLWQIALVETLADLARVEPHVKLIIVLEPDRGARPSEVERRAKSFGGPALVVGATEPAAALAEVRAALRSASPAALPRE